MLFFYLSTYILDAFNFFASQAFNIDPPTLGHPFPLPSRLLRESTRVQSSHNVHSELWASVLSRTMSSAPEDDDYEEVYDDQTLQWISGKEATH
jgi:hypothetical protein